MSTYAYDWVRTYSTAEGTALTVHLHIADSVSSGNGWRYSNPLAYIARACRCTDRTVRSAARWLEENGYLELLVDNSSSGRGDANIYRFLMPEGMPAVYDGTTPTGTPAQDHPLSSPVEKLGSAKGTKKGARS